MDLIVPLFDAVVKGDEAAVNHIINIGGNILVNDEDGLTALHWTAATEESEKLVPYLISIGAKINAKDHNGRTALHFHCANGRSFAVACLLHSGADINCVTAFEKISPLDVALMHNHTEITNLLMTYGAECTIRN
jgi:ankyrin repeat protein